MPAAPRSPDKRVASFLAVEDDFGVWISAGKTTPWSAWSRVRATFRPGRSRAGAVVLMKVSRNHVNAHPMAGPFLSLLETSGQNVLIDPFLTGNPKAATTAEHVAADLILISHGHGDHVGDAVAIARRTGAKVLSNYEISNWLQQDPRGRPRSMVSSTVGATHSTAEFA